MTEALQTHLGTVAEYLQDRQWDKWFARRAVQMGFEYWCDGLVELESTQKVNGSHLVEARVSGTAVDPYLVKILIPAKGDFRLEGACSCPVEGSCKHQAAVLTAIEESLSESAGQDGGNADDDWFSIFEQPPISQQEINRRRADSLLQARTPAGLSGARSGGVTPATEQWVEAINRKGKTQIRPALSDHFTELEPGQTGVVYQLGFPKNWNPSRGGIIEMELCRIRMQKSKLAKPTRISIKKVSIGDYDPCLNPAEIRRLQAMLDLCHGEPVAEPGYSFRPRRRDWFEIVEGILEDRLAIWVGSSPIPLERGRPVEIEPCWVQRGDETLMTGIRTVEGREPVAIFAVDPPLYVLPEKNQFGEAKPSFPDGISAVDWLAAPPVSPTEFRQVNEMLELPLKDDSPGDDRHGSEAPCLPRLPEIQTSEVDGKETPPSGRLLLKRVDLFEYRSAGGFPYWNYRTPVGASQLSDFPVAMVSFRYGDTLLDNPVVAPEQAEVVSGESIVTVKRNLAAEKALVAGLFRTGLSSLDELPLDFTGYFEKKGCENLLTTYDAGREGAIPWARWVSEYRDELADQGWELEIDPSFYFQLADSNSWFSGLESSPEHGIDWMTFDCGIEHEGRKISLTSVLAEILEQEGTGFDPGELLEAHEEDTVPVYIERENLLVPVPARRLGQIYHAVTELFNLDTRSVQLHPLRASQIIVEMGLDQFDDSETVRQLKELGRRIRDFEGIEDVRPPKALRAELRPYQSEGLSWLQFLRETGLNGILADDMGLGKTVQTLACLQKEKSSRRLKQPALIIAPTSVVSNWISEAGKFTPGLKTLLLHGNDRKPLFAAIPDHDIVVTSYALLNRDIERHLENEYHYVILDEAQLIKNPKSKMAQNACRLKSNHRLCLTGTPMENHLGELWSLVHFLMPGFLGRYEEFRKFWQRPIENHDDCFRRDRLVQKISPLLLRRTKDLVLEDLPPRTDIVHDVTLDKAQTDLYESVRAAMDKRVRDALQDKGLNRSHIIVLDALLKLRQICCHPRLLKTESAKKVKHSAKLEAFEDLVSKQVEVGRRILVFSQFTSMISILEESLDQLGIPHVKLTGSTRKRKEVIDRFQNGEAPVFLISLKAGGSGLNLTAADCVIHYDPWWNPAVEEQATARAHRIGQENPVFVYRLVTKGSIEERILELQEKKAEIARAVLSAGQSGEDGGEGMKSLTRDDLEMLFAPMDQ